MNKIEDNISITSQGRLEEKITSSKFDGIPNIRLFLPREINALGIASSFDI